MRKVFYTWLRMTHLGSVSRTGVLALVFLLSGCASNSSGSYPTLKQTNIRVSWEMTRFRNAATWGRLTLGERERGHAAYSAYQTAFDQALRAANGNSKAPTPANVTELANETIRVLSAIPY